MTGRQQKLAFAFTVYRHCVVHGEYRVGAIEGSILLQSCCLCRNIGEREKLLSFCYLSVRRCLILNIILEVILVGCFQRIRKQACVDVLGVDLVLDTETRVLRQVEGDGAVGLVLTALHIEHLEGMLSRRVLVVKINTVNLKELFNIYGVHKIGTSRVILTNCIQV